MTTPKIEIFFSQLCGGCHDAMDYFRERGHEFQSFEVKWDPDGSLAQGENEDELRRRLGDADFVPQIFIDDKHIGGWMALSGLIESGEIDDVLPPT